MSCPFDAEKSGAVTVGAWFAGTLTWNSFGPLKRLPSQTFTNRSPELDVPAVQVAGGGVAPRREGGLPKLAPRHSESGARRLHRAADREMAAPGGRAVVVEE